MRIGQNQAELVMLVAQPAAITIGNSRIQIPGIRLGLQCTYSQVFKLALNFPE